MTLLLAYARIIERSETAVALALVAAASLDTRLTRDERARLDRAATAAILRNNSRRKPAT